MILVTGAAGKTGQAVTQALIERYESPAVFVRSHEQAAAMSESGLQEVTVGDFEDADSVRRAMEGVQVVYHICPNMHPQEIAIGRVVIDAAAAAGVERFVYHSVLHPQTEKMSHHWQKLRVEEMLCESGLEFTILQPAIYMQNILTSREAIRRQGRYPVPYAVETRLSFVDLADVAETAARVLTGPGHSHATYELVGTPPLSQVEVAAILSEALGCQVEAEVIDRDAWRQVQTTRHPPLSDYTVESLLAMFHYYELCGLGGNANVLRWLLGREPVSLLSFARSNLARPQQRSLV